MDGGLSFEEGHRGWRADLRKKLSSVWERLNSRYLWDIQREISRCTKESSEPEILDVGEVRLKLGFPFKLDQ